MSFGASGVRGRAPQDAPFVLLRRSKGVPNGSPIQAGPGVSLNEPGAGEPLVISAAGAGTGRVQGLFTKSAISDATVTGIFRITTANESGSADGGGYSVHLRASVGHAVSSTEATAAVKAVSASFSRQMGGAGAGVSSPVALEAGSSAAVTPATRDVGAVSVTLSEASEYALDVQFTLDLTGSSIGTGHVVCSVELLWHGFLTAPTLTAL